MKFIYCLFLSLFICLGLSAGNNRTLAWFQDMSSGQVIPDFQGSIHAVNQALPIYSETQKPEFSAKSYKARLIYPMFQKLTTEEIHSLKTSLKKLPDSICVNVSLGMERKKQLLDLSFCPFIKKENTYYKLISFDWEIKPVGSPLRSATAVQARTGYAASSALSSGKWSKVSVTETGLYKLTYSDIVGMGINPANVQIYGYGGALLEEDFTLAGYLDDLPEVAVWKELGNDGIFNDGDYILFYAQGPISWKYDTTSAMYRRVRNHYSDKAYYFVGERTNGTKTTALSTFAGTSTVNITTFTDFILHETERVNIGESVANSGTGRQLYGEDFTSITSQTFNFDVPNLDTTQLSKVQVEFIAKNTGQSSCKVSINNAFLGNLTMTQIMTSDDYQYANVSNKTYSFTPLNKSISVKLDYYKNGNSAKHRACLNYIDLNVSRYLKMTGSSLIFRDPKSVGINQIGRFTIQNANEKTVVFNVTDPEAMFQVNGALNGTNYVFNASTSTLSEYVCADLNGSFPKPTMEGSVANQDIHGYAQADMVILVPPEFMSYARTLAQAHATYDNLSTLIVTPEQVYNEFSSGTPDATAIRRMMKYFYDKATSEVDLPKYLLLFGDGVYDNRLVSSMFAKNTSKPNKILTYQSIESLDCNSSYVTDDYYGFLDDSEGSNLALDMLDIGIGRFPVSSPEQAKTAVDKTISYMTNTRKGVWKNRLLYLADDGNNYIHENQADGLAKSVTLNHPEFMVNKIYVDAYPRVTTVSGSTVPDANKRFSELLNSGLLMVNYTGHGSTSQWAEEKLLTTAGIKLMTNKCLPLFITATCDFTRYDAPETSGGEYVFLNPNGGGIGLFTTTRVVYSTSNSTLNQSFAANIFAKNNGICFTLGDIMNRSKLSSTLKGDANKLSFTLIGDPALKLAYPQYSSKVTQINGQNISESVDTLHALSNVTVSGEIYREDGSLAEDFNGVVIPTVMDAEDVLMSWTDNPDSYQPVTNTFYDRSKVLFSGKDSVQNGHFSFSFVVPKDISYSSKKSLINLYAYDQSGKNEAQGVYDNFVLFGTEASTTLNYTGPKIELYLNSSSFVSGEVVNETPTLLARISDENGLNTSGNGIGHDLMLTVDGLPTQTYNLNRYFTSNIGSYTSGVVQFVLPELSKGTHSLSFKAWDVQNNSNVDTLLFEVKPGLSPSVSDLKYTQQGESSFFLFTHDRPEVYVSVNLCIYDLLGRSIWKTNWNMQTSENLSDQIDWNLTDTNGRRVPNGIYICNVLFTDSSGAQTTESKKIQISGQ